MSFWAPILSLQAVIRCRNHLVKFLLSSSLSKIANLPLQFRRRMSQFQRYNYFRFWRSYNYFRLPVVFEITVFEIAIVGFPGFAVEKEQIRRFSK